MTIATRAAAAKPEDTAGLLEELFKALYPKPDRSNEPEWRGPGTLREPLYHHWFTRINRFQKMIAAEAFIDAAMMLVPDGWLIVHLSELGAAGGCVCKLGNPETGDDTIADAGERTMALALIAAIAESKGV